MFVFDILVLFFLGLEHQSELRPTQFLDQFQSNHVLEGFSNQQFHAIQLQSDRLLYFLIND